MNNLNKYLIFIMVTFVITGCNNNEKEKNETEKITELAYSKTYNPFVVFDSIISFYEWRVNDSLLHIEWAGLNKDTNIVLNAQSDLNHSYIKMRSLSKVIHSDSGAIEIIMNSYGAEYHVSIEGEDTVYFKGEYLYRFENGLLNSEEFSFYLDNIDSLNSW